MPSQEDFWYAVSHTETVLEPSQALETFGATIIDYYMVSELMDSVGQIRVREGRIHAERPRVIMPAHYAHRLLDNFGNEAREYADWLMQSPKGMRIVQFGLRFRKEEHKQQILTGKVEDVAEQIAEDKRGKSNGMTAVIIGVDDLWEISLIKFASDVVQESAPTNVKELSQHGLLDATSNDVPNAVRIEIESDFRAVGDDLEKAKALGQKLRDYGLFGQYEDRFYTLYRSLTS